MAETYETLREVGVAIDGVRGELSSLKWIIGGLGGVGVLFGGFLMTKLDAVEATNARNSAILERIETAVNRTAFNTDEIRERIQTASVPGPEVFPGWKGVSLGREPVEGGFGRGRETGGGRLAVFSEVGRLFRRWNEKDRALVAPGLLISGVGLQPLFPAGEGRRP